MQWVRHGNFKVRIEADENHPSECCNDIAARFMPMLAATERISI